MARIKVTAYVETDDLEPTEVDVSHETGLSEIGFEKYAIAPYRLPLHEPEFEIEHD